MSVRHENSYFCGTGMGGGEFRELVVETAGRAPSEQGRSVMRATIINHAKG